MNIKNVTQKTFEFQKFRYTCLSRFLDPGADHAECLLLY